MKLIKVIFTVLIVVTVSCKRNTEKSEINSIRNDGKTQFDVTTATAIIEKRNKDFEDALKAGDSIAVGDIYTIDSKIIGAYAGRDNLIKEVH